MVSSLLEDFAGEIDLVYIDPSFDTGADFSMRVRIGDGGEGPSRPPLVPGRHATIRP